MRGIPCRVSLRRSLVVRVVPPAEMPRLRAEIDTHHWLGYRASGQVVCYAA